MALPIHSTRAAIHPMSVLIHTGKLFKNQLSKILVHLPISVNAIGAASTIHCQSAVLQLVKLVTQLGKFSITHPEMNSHHSCNLLMAIGVASTIHCQIAWPQPASIPPHTGRLFAIHSNSAIDHSPIFWMAIGVASTIHCQTAWPQPNNIACH